MTQWTWDYQLIDDDGHVSSHLVARFDDERLEELQARFAEFLRGCGYDVPEVDREGMLLDEAMDLLHDVGDKYPEAWERRYKALLDKYEEVLK
jgi:hypothetical protein